MNFEYQIAMRVQVSRIYLIIWIYTDNWKLKVAKKLIIIQQIIFKTIIPNTKLLHAEKPPNNYTVIWKLTNFILKTMHFQPTAYWLLKHETYKLWKKCS